MLTITGLISHSGADPCWHGGPSQERIRRIHRLTHTDFEGRRFYRRNAAEGWRRLRSAEDFRTLNRALESDHF